MCNASCRYPMPMKGCPELSGFDPCAPILFLFLATSYLALMLKVWLGPRATLMLPGSPMSFPEIGLKTARELFGGSEKSTRIETLPFTPEDFDNGGRLAEEIKKNGILIFQK